MSEDTVCAVVVTYNRKKLLLECLESFKRQSYPLNAIYIIDNASTDNTPKLLLENGYITELPPDLNENWETCSIIKNLTDNGQLKLHYVRMHENTGGAGGFYEGVKRAYEKGYDWLWLMDDDSEPEKEALEELSKYFKNGNISALANVVKNPNGEIDNRLRGYFDFQKEYRSFLIPIEDINYRSTDVSIDFVSFVGVLIKSSIIEKIGFPKRELFIFADDGDYSVKLNKHGKILLITRSIVIHKYATSLDEQSKRIFGIYYPKNEISNYWLNYIGIRNVVWFGKTHSINKAFFYAHLLFNYIKNLMGIILFNDFKLKRINMITNAYIDGLKSNFDNEKPKKMLYKH